MCRWLYPSYFRWPELGLSLPLSSFRWPDFDFSSYLRTGACPLRWLEFSIDEILWSLATAVESVALVAMLCYFFLFCGCTL
ncbi:unnamed protein product [Linum tenue]|uniref:Uncharacterized protein n=1 Tax=Linum tenue TaxID=586396 RepID=A0AAV0S3S1_9ROSI|nr:unnamed protein product [Linum tenue]